MINRRKLTPNLVSKTETVNDGRGEQQIGLLKLTFLHLAFSGDIKGGNGRLGSKRVSGIFHATSTSFRTPRMCGLTRVNGIGFLLGLRKGVICVQALEGDYPIVEIKRNGD